MGNLQRKSPPLTISTSEIYNKEYMWKQILNEPLMPNWDGVVKMNKEFMKKNNNKMEKKLILLEKELFDLGAQKHPFQMSAETTVYRVGKKSFVRNDITGVIYRNIPNGAEENPDDNVALYKNTPSLTSFFVNKEEFYKYIGVGYQEAEGFPVSYKVNVIATPETKTKRYIIEIGESTYYQLGINEWDVLWGFMNKNRELDYKNVTIEEDTSPEIPVEHHIILERLDKMVAEIYEIKKILYKWVKVEVRVPDDGC